MLALGLCLDCSKGEKSLIVFHASLNLAGPLGLEFEVFFVEAYTDTHKQKYC